MKASVHLLVALAALLMAGGVQAQGLETAPLIGGVQLQCRDFRGLVVRTTRTTQLGDVGRASIIARMPIISLDSDRNATLPATLQIFFYMHECAHHVLGHNFRPTVTSEREADCWSIKHGRDNHLLTRQDVEGFAPYFAQSRGSPAGHLPGPERQAYLLGCFDDPSEQSASNR